MPGGTPTGSATVELNVSKLSDVTDSEDLRLDYFGSGATANSHFYEIAAGSNPSNYKWFVWGINDVCPDWFEEVYPAIYTRSGIPVSGYLSPTYRGALSKAPAWVERVRVDSTANTFAESAPQFDVSQLPEEFQIGADRILTRTTGN